MLAIVLGEGEQTTKEDSSVRFEVVEIQASGSPVRVQSPSAGLDVRADRLGYELHTGRILLDGEDPVSIHATGVEIEAKSVDYTPGQDNTIGSLMAIGPGCSAMDENSQPSNLAGKNGCGFVQMKRGMLLQYPVKLKCRFAG